MVLNSFAKLSLYCLRMSSDIWFVFVNSEKLRANTKYLVTISRNSFVCSINAFLSISFLAFSNLFLKVEYQEKRTHEKLSS